MIFQAKFKLSNEEGIKLEDYIVSDVCCIQHFTEYINEFFESGKFIELLLAEDEEFTEEELEELLSLDYEITQIKKIEGAFIEFEILDEITGQQSKNKIDPKLGNFGLSNNMN